MSVSRYRTRAGTDAKQLFAASVGGDEVVLCKGGELLASGTTAAQWHIRHPLIISGLSSLLRCTLRSFLTSTFPKSRQTHRDRFAPRPAREAVIESLKALASVVDSDSTPQMEPGGSFG